MTAIVCWGELVWDLLPSGPRLGGAVANVAYHLAALGAEPRLVTRVGADELGRRAIDELRAAGVDTRWVQIDPNRPTGQVHVWFEGDQPRYRIAESAAWDAMDLPEGLVPELEQAAALVHGTLAQRTLIARGALSQALDHSKGLRVCDLNLRAPYDTADVVHDAIRRADVIKVNEDEHRILERLAVGSPALLAETRGDRGARLIRGEQVADHPGFAAEAGGDAIGCGDAFTAVLTLGLIAGTPLDRLVEQACRYAAFVAGREGAMPAIPPEIARLELEPRP